MTRRPASIAVLLLVLTFGVGALTGMALEEALGIDWFEFLDEESETEDLLLTGLNLTDTQRERVDRILEREEDRLAEYWEGRLPEIQEMLRQTYAEIRAILDAGQQPIFDQRIRQLDGRVPEEIRD